MTKKVLLIIGIVVVVIIAAAVLITRLGVSDFSGTYRLTSGGKGSDAVMRVTLEGSYYNIQISGVKDLHASYRIKRVLKNTIILVDENAGDKTAEYELRHTNNGFEGKVWVLPIGEVNVKFEKIED